MGACVMESDASFIKHEPCPNCGSKDNLARYADGGGHCFGCEYHEFPEGETSSPTPLETKGGGSVLTDLEYKPLPKRGITVDTCKKFGYMIGKYKDQPVQVCQFRNNTGEVEAQKLRYPNKDFRWINKSDALFGQHLWEKGKWVVVTEGEIDALTVSQLFNNRWATVSITTGATGAKKQLAKNLEWLEKFDHVVLMFDEDEAGRKAISECVELFSPGKVKIASLPMKDANECLLNNLGQAVVSAVWDAKVYRPDGIINAKDTWDIFIRDDKVEAKEYPWKTVNDFLSGLRKKELVTITAGSGIGKSLFCRELAYSLLEQGETIGYVALEENIKRTVQGFASIYLNAPLHLGRGDFTEEELRKAWDVSAGSDRLYLYDHFGSLDSGSLLSRLRYLARSCDCSYIFLDHISIVISGTETTDERKALDIIMTKLRSLVEETGVGLILVSHLRRLQGDKGHEEGQVTSLSHLRGSASIAQLSDVVVGLERNQQADGKDQTNVRVLKNRHSGVTGLGGLLQYDISTGRLIEKEIFEEENSGEEMIF